MRGRPTCPTGQEKNLVEATAGSAPFFYKERLGTKSPPHPTRLRRPTFPPRGRLWGWVLSFRVSTVPPIYPAGHASQSFPARRRGKKMKSCFDRLRRPKHTSHPESAGSAGAVRGASPNFGRGLPPSRQLDTPVLCPPERRQTPGAPPKIPHSTLFSASTISKSRSFLRAVRFTAKEKTTVNTAAHR